MSGIVRIADRMSCNPRNTVLSGSTTVFVGGLGVVRTGDPTSPHPGGGPAVMLTANGAGVHADGILVCVTGSKNSPHGSGPHATSTAIGSTTTGNIG